MGQQQPHNEVTPALWVEGLEWKLHEGGDSLSALFTAASPVPKTRFGTKKVLAGQMLK